MKTTELAVLGAGPGGYAAAFRAADLGLEVTLIDRSAQLGGVCVNTGCIPTKALLHVAETLEGVTRAADFGLGITQGTPDLKAIGLWRDKAVQRMSGGLGQLAKQRKVKVITGEAHFIGHHELAIKSLEGDESLCFEQAIIAAGSRPVRLPFLPDDPRVWDSTEALALHQVPPHLLVIGGGIIGLEMATIYAALGSRVTIVEAAPQLVPEADADLLGVWQNANRERMQWHLSTQVTAVQAHPEHLCVALQAENGEAFTLDADAVLVAVGRRPNGDLIRAEAAGVKVTDRGFIPVDAQGRTAQSHIFAIGDLVDGPMLAHKASHEGHVAAENAAGLRRAFDARAIPSVAYTHPEIAWAGLTEKAALAVGRPVRTAVFPWAASGRAVSSGVSGGRTKLILDPETEQVLGAGLAGAHAGELLGEISLAIEFGACAEDLALTVHAHPTLHETVGLAGELAAGTITDLRNPGALQAAGRSTSSQESQPVSVVST